MADIADVRQAIVNLISATVYPNGPLYPGIPLGAGPIMVIPGWPKSADLAPSFMAPITQGGQNGVVVSVVDFGAARSTTRFPQRSRFVSRPTATLSWSVTNNTATLSGTIAVPQNLALILNERQHAAYSVQPTDTIATILAGLAAALPAGFSATIAGPTITVTGAFSLIARVGVISNRIRPVSQQRQKFMVAIWASSDVVRAAVSKAVKPVLDYRKFLAFPDGSGGNIFSGTEVTVPVPTKLGLSESRILYDVEYSTVLLETAPQAIVAQTSIGTAPGAQFNTTEA